MSYRSDYQKKYYQEHKEELAKYYHDKYEAERKERLTYQRTYYILNRMVILLKAKFRDTSKKGHAHAIWKATTKYAKEWNIPFVPWDKFKTWAMTDDGYETIYKQWEESGFDRTFGPVVMRQVKKNGFIPDNLKWDYREQYSWWSNEMENFKQVEKNLDTQQQERNKRTKEWQKKVREEFKAKRKNK